MSEDTRNALNALLYNTGSASRRLMMVLATNRAEVGVNRKHTSHITHPFHQHDNLLHRGDERLLPKPPER